MPDEIYNLAAQSHVAVSFEVPEYTGNVDGLGTLRILDVIKSLGKKKKIKFYQAGTSEMFGGTQKSYQDEKTPFDPKVLMQPEKSMHIILQRYIEMLIIYSPVMEFYLIMRVL